MFQGGCGGTDYCDDTAPQNVPSYSKQGPSGGLKSCPAKDTCPNLPGSDNVLNFVSLDISSLRTRTTLTSIDIDGLHRLLF